MTDLLLVTPPPLKSTMGPLLGPALIHGACAGAGFVVRQRDLAIEFVREAVGASFDDDWTTTGLVGDHAKAPGIQAAVDQTARVWSADLVSGAHAGSAGLGACMYDGRELDEIVARGICEGSPWRAFFGRHLFDVTAAPRVLGISILFGGQVAPAAILSALAREVWPGTAILLGGPHVTALDPDLPADGLARLVDGFVVGRGEVAVPRLLGLPRARWVEVEGFRPATGARRPGRGPMEIVCPVFEELDLYRRSELTIPYQLSLGCAYGRCRYCTYPSEGAYQPGAMDAHLEVLARAVGQTGVRRVSFKDSLLLPRRLSELASGLARRNLDIEWSATTKVSRANWRHLVPRLAGAGLRTVELGFETSLPRLQAIIDKRERAEHLLEIVEACRRVGVRVVVNRITSFPWQTAVEAERDEAFFAGLARGGVHVESNVFELERRAPFARDPARCGLEVTRSWPWATRLEARVSRAPRAFTPRRLALVAAGALPSVPATGAEVTR